jgi:hypothetical protein
VFRVDVAVTNAEGRVRHDVAMTFPEPIGPRWCEKSPAPVLFPDGVQFHAAAPHTGLLGISIRAEGRQGESDVVVMRGIVDDHAYLAGIALAAAAVAVVNERPEGTVEITRYSGHYLEAAVNAGLEVAAFSAAS